MTLRVDRLRIDRLHIRLPAHMEAMAPEVAQQVARSLASMTIPRAGYHPTMTIVINSAHDAGPGDLAAAITRHIAHRISGQKNHG